MTSANNLPPRKCKLAECRKEFQPVTSWQEFHSPFCRNRAKYLLFKQGYKLLQERQKVKA